MLELEMSGKVHVIENEDVFPVKSANEITYDDFYRDFLQENRPCLIRDLMERWPARKELVSQDNLPNVEFFKQLENVSVPVAKCSTKYFNSQEKVSMSLLEYLQQWQSKDSSLYLKDWHFVKQFPKIKLYQTPKYFASDWLNEYWLDQEDDYKFVYLGPQGSWTPFHSDVFGSYSWSANVAGYKRWIFFLPGFEPRDTYDIFDVIPKTEESSFKLQTYEQFKYFQIEQGPGEVIFVPSGWYHQVMNITDTLSINHNWFNASNIHFIWSQLEQELSNVKKEISDCFEENNDEWKNMCQSLLLASHGMNYTTFIDLLDMISDVRMIKNTLNFDGWTFGPNHISFDLNQIKNLIDKILKTSKCDLLHRDREKAEKILTNILVFSPHHH